MGILKNYLNGQAGEYLTFKSAGQHKVELLLVCLLCTMGVPSLVNAQEAAAQSIKVGETDLVPAIRLDYVSTDNAFYSNSSNNPVEATGLIISPSVTWQAGRRLLNLSASYKGAYGSYSESILDFNSHDLAFRIDAAPGARHRAFGEFTIKSQHEELGTGQTTFVSNATKQVVSTTVTLNTGYTFGVPSARGNLGGGLVIGTETFNNVVGITEGDDNSEITPYVFFSYRLSPDVRFLTQVNFRLTDFDEDRRDRTEISLLTGLNIAATERTGGSVQFGVSSADYDRVGVSDTTQVISDVSLYFKPRSYSRFDLLFRRNLATVDDDASGAGASLVNQGRLSWRHEWTSRFSTTSSVRATQIERNCPNNDSSTNAAGIEFDVKVRRWLTMGAGVVSASRSADLCDRSLPAGEFDADRTTVSLHVRGSL